MNTFETTFVDLDPFSSTGGVAKAFSPSGRYLVLARGMIRIWDLQNLPEILRDRDPVYAWPGPDELVRGVSFIDEDTLELTISSDTGKTYRMNIHTGEFWLVESP
jgi:WD40 repeat protein